jgi:hypothetical protein
MRMLVELAASSVRARRAIWQDRKALQGGPGTDSEERARSVSGLALFCPDRLVRWISHA